MFKSLKVRALTILGIAGLCAFFLWQNYSRTGTPVTLGLDLRGGTHLALEIDDRESPMAPAQRSDAIDRALQIIRTRIDELGVAEPIVQKSGDDRIIVELPGASQAEQRRAREVIERTAFLQFQIVRDLDEMMRALPRMDRAVVEALGPEALAEAPTQPATPAVGDLLRDAPDEEAAPGEEGAAAEPAADQARPLSPLLIPTGQVGQFAVAETDIPRVERYLALPEVQRLLPRASELRWSQHAQGGYRTLYLLEQRPLITGEYLEDAQAQRDQMTGRPEVQFTMNRAGGRIFERGTGANIGNFMAIVLENRVFSAPTIEGQIGTRGRITLGGASMEEARDLALVLRAGALPAPVMVVEERTVGPSLGADSIAQGQLAGMIGIALVLLTMLLYYRVSGALAVAALSIYLLFVMGGLAGIGAALTLPGIAGLILSIGMAVDANVLIFERIREELDAGRSPRAAVNEGFGHALSAIVDANVTTLITAVILFYFGTGPVQGFAVTLAIGIVASMFTAIFVTRTFFMIYVERRSAQTVSI
jgi:protein-export membrane protein SecD